MVYSSSDLQEQWEETDEIIQAYKLQALLPLEAMSCCSDVDQFPTEDMVNCTITMLRNFALRCENAELVSFLNEVILEK